MMGIARKLLICSVLLCTYLLSIHQTFPIKLYSNYKAIISLTTFILYTGDHC